MVVCQGGKQRLGKKIFKVVSAIENEINHRLQ